jgi:hypothetical protein
MGSQNSHTTQLLRWSGWALALSGLLTFVPALLHPDIESNPAAILSANWIAIHVPFLISILLALFGLTGLYLRQQAETGVAGLLGYILTMTGSALFVAILTIDTFIVPVLAANPTTAALLDDSGPLFGGLLGLVFLVTGLLFALGLILLALATLRAAILPRPAALLLPLGILLAFSPPLPNLFAVIGGVGLGVAYLWLGLALSATQSTTAMLKPATA